MSFFSRAVYKEIELPFITDIYSNWKTDREAGIINIEAYGDIDGELKCFYSAYCLNDITMYDNGDYEEMLGLLKNPQGKTIVIRLKYKKDKLIDFKTNIESIVRAYNDERFYQLDLLGWGINDRSCKELVKI